jgi:hypothetical protein
MNNLVRKLFNPSDGIFHEFEGIKAHFEPEDLDLYQKLLPKPFTLPRQPLVAVFIADYLRVTLRPLFTHYRYLEYCVLLRSSWKGREEWYPAAIAVTGRVAKWLGIYLGFPKYLAKVTLEKKGKERHGVVNHKGIKELEMDFCPGVTRPLVDWEKDELAHESFFPGSAHLLFPPARGPRAHTLDLLHVIQPEWSPQSGMIQIRANPSMPWYRLIPQTPDFLGTYNHYTGGMNLMIV